MPLNLFGKIFKHTVLFLLIAELLSLLTFVTPLFGQVAFFAVLIAALVLALIKLEYGLYILLAELFVGGKGYLFAFDLNGTLISVRIALFLVVLAVWLYQVIKKRRLGFELDKKIVISFSVLAAAIGLGLINGFLNNEFADIFFDFNGWLYFALIVVFLSVIKSQKIMENAWQTLVAATGYLAAKTVLVLLLFSYNFAGIGGVFYHWIRSSGVGEITYVSGSIFRVFFQSQIYVLIGFFVVLAILIGQKKMAEKKNYFFVGAYLYLTGLAIIISQSRSFWVGGLAAALLLLFFSWWRFNFRLKKTAILMAALGIMVISQIFLIQLLTGNLSGNLVASRFNNLESEAAGISRLNQLKPLTDNIFQRLIFGYGFGKTLTYISSDPRILQTHPGGVYTTFAFEWGYFDIWLKLGLVGLLAYAFLIYQLVMVALRSDKQKMPMTIGMLTGLAAVLVTNIFSPYLNHPLGIGYIILLAAIYGQK